MSAIYLKNLEKNHDELSKAMHSVLWVNIRQAFSDPLYHAKELTEYYAISIRGSIPYNDRDNIAFGMERLCYALIHFPLTHEFYTQLPEKLVIKTDQERFDIARYIYLNLELCNKEHRYTDNLKNFIFTEKQ